MRENISQKVSYDLVILTINRKSLNGCVMECRLVSMSYFFAMAFIHALLLRAFLCASKTFLHSNNKKEKHGCRPNCAWFNIMEIRVVPVPAGFEIVKSGKTLIKTCRNKTSGVTQWTVACHRVWRFGR